jgi:hypothetical protein
MLLDSGADASVVPQQVVQLLSAAEHATAYEIEHLEGSVATLTSVRLQIDPLALSPSPDTES